MPEPEPIYVDLELVRGDDPIITDPESELVGVSAELAFAVFADAITAAQGDWRVD